MRFCVDGRFWHYKTREECRQKICFYSEAAGCSVIDLKYNEDRIASNNPYQC